MQTSMEDGIAILKLSSPPMNALTTEVRARVGFCAYAGAIEVPPGLHRRQAWPDSGC